MISEQDLQIELDKWKNDSIRGGAMSNQLIQKTLKEQNLELERLGEIAWKRHLMQMKEFQNKVREEDDFLQRKLDG